MEIIISRLGCQLDDATTIPAVLRVEGLGQDANLRQFIESEKKAGGTCRRIAEDGVIGIHTVDQNVCPTRTHAINRHLSGLAARKQRRSTAGRWGDTRFQDGGLKETATIERKFSQAFLWKQTTDRGRSIVDC